MPAQFGAKRKSIELRHHDVEKDEIGFFLQRATQASLAIRGSENAIPFASQHVVQGRAHRELVFDDQDAFHGAGSSKIEIRSSKQYRKSKLESLNPMQKGRAGSRRAEGLVERMPQSSRESGMGLPHSTTLSRAIARLSFREVVECGSPMALSSSFLSTSAII
jgi:hypothetical protein